MCPLELPYRLPSLPLITKTQMTQGRGQKAEVGGQKAEGRSQRAEVRGQKAEGRSQRAEVRGQKAVPSTAQAWAVQHRRFMERPRREEV